MRTSPAGTRISAEQCADLLDSCPVKSSHNVGFTLVHILQKEDSADQIILVQDLSSEILLIQ